MNATLSPHSSRSAASFRDGAAPGLGSAPPLRPRLIADLWRRLLAGGARPLRFAAVGGVCGLVQLVLLVLLKGAGLAAIPANIAAYLLSAQLNFALSNRFIWHDRWSGSATSRDLLRRWLAFHGSIAGTFVLSQAVFIVVRAALPDLLASALGIGVAAIANFLIQDRLTFQQIRPRRASATLPLLLERHDQPPPPRGPEQTPQEAPAQALGLTRRTIMATTHIPFQPPTALPDLAETAAARSAPPRRARVDLVIPVYNEEHVLEQSVTTLYGFLTEQLPCDWRILIADNASTDGTLTVARRLVRRFPGVGIVHLDEKGRGRALRAAWLASDADVLSYMDVDLSTEIEAYPALIRAIVDEGYDLAIGSRLARGAQTTRSFKREAISRAYNLLIKAVMWTRFSDAQCGFKAISRRAAQALIPLVENNEWFFDTELLTLAEKKGYRIKDIPVRWIEDPDTRVKLGKTIREDLRGLWRLRTRPMP